MISIIICSIRDERYIQLESNITEMIGEVEFEIIRIDNSIEKLSITKAYNKGAKLGKYNYLLFIHEDISFHTQNWGAILIEELSKESVGIVGVAGSSYIPYVPLGYTNPLKKYNFHYLIQHTEKKQILFSNLPSENDNVKAIDGVFLGLRRDVFEKTKFNEALPGFHGYDLDFSLRVSVNYKNIITDKILLEHFSFGTPDEQYLRNNISIKRSLKINNAINDPLNEYSSFRVFIKDLYLNNFSKKEIKELTTEFRSISRFGFLNYLKSYYFTFQEKLNN